MFHIKKRDHNLALIHSDLCFTLRLKAQASPCCWILALVKERFLNRTLRSEKLKALGLFTGVAYPMTHGICDILLQARILALVRRHHFLPFFTSSFTRQNLLLLHYLFHLAFLHYVLCHILLDLVSWPLNKVIYIIGTNDSSRVSSAHFILFIILTPHSY
jgi:hypothetical protein